LTILPEFYFSNSPLNAVRLAQSKRLMTSFTYDANRLDTVMADWLNSQFRYNYDELTG
jgi:hypothetical protein